MPTCIIKDNYGEDPTSIVPPSVMPLLLLWEIVTTYPESSMNTLRHSIPYLSGSSIPGISDFDDLPK